MGRRKQGESLIRTKPYILAGTVAVACFFCIHSRPADAGDSSKYPGVLYSHPLLGQDAPDFELETLEDDEIRLSEYRNKWVVLMFGASWCPYTNKKIQTMNTAQPKYRGKDVQFLVVSVQEKEKKVEKWRQKRKIGYPVLLDEKGKVSEKYSIPGVYPEISRSEMVISSNFLIDPQGKIAYFESCSPTGCEGGIDGLWARLDQSLAAK